MTVFVTGDVHGGCDMQKLYDWDSAVGESLDADDYLIVAGDFGYPWDYSRGECDEIAWLEARPYNVLFVDGNHEQFAHWETRPLEMWHGGLTQRLSEDSPIRRLCRGELFELGGSCVFVLGGAASTDMDWRTPGIDWWPQELPSEEELAHADEVLAGCGWKVDYVITHTCSNRMLPYALYPDKTWQTPERDRFTGYLDTLEDRLAFRRWYFGHFHRDRDLDDTHTVLYNEVVRLGDGVLPVAGA